MGTIHPYILASLTNKLTKIDDGSSNSASKQQTQPPCLPACLKEKVTSASSRQVRQLKSPDDPAPAWRRENSECVGAERRRDLGLGVGASKIRPFIISLNGNGGFKP
uniref:Uncharacterized protein n=1 Tax=Oryza glumipatula TaxID=40148 RepID=A0A0D9ZT12_9ORYZ